VLRLLSRKEDHNINVDKEKMMKYETIELIRDEEIAFIYLNRPEALNALNEMMKDELIHALKETQEDDSIRVMILTGRGRGFLCRCRSQQVYRCSKTW
jgi:1,4-dihydroxy-2-naphthoyl-CoA synthase